jgi:hypothetical protein
MKAPSWCSCSPRATCTHTQPHKNTRVPVWHIHIDAGEPCCFASAGPSAQLPDRQALPNHAPTLSASSRLTTEAIRPKQKDRKKPPMTYCERQGRERRDRGGWALPLGPVCGAAVGLEARPSCGLSRGPLCQGSGSARAQAPPPTHPLTMVNMHQICVYGGTHTDARTHAVV